MSKRQREKGTIGRKYYLPNLPDEHKNMKKRI